MANYGALRIEKCVNLAEEVEYVKVGDLKPYLGKVYLKAKIVEIGEPREVSGGEHRISEALIGDETGCIYLSLWDDNIEQFKMGDAVHVENGYVSVFKESMRLTAGKYGTITKTEEELPEASTDNNLSNQRVEQRPRRSFGSFGERFGGDYRPRGYGGDRGRRGDWKSGYKKRRF